MSKLEHLVGGTWDAFEIKRDNHAWVWWVVGVFVVLIIIGKLAG